MAQKIITNSVRPYTDLRPNLSPAQPKKSWPASVPHSATDDTAASRLMGSLPGLTRPGGGGASERCDTGWRNACRRTLVVRPERLQHRRGVDNVQGVEAVGGRRHQRRSAAARPQVVDGRLDDGHQDLVAVGHAAGGPHDAAQEPGGHAVHAGADVGVGGGAVGVVDEVQAVRLRDAVLHKAPPRRRHVAGRPARAAGLHRAGDACVEGRVVGVRRILSGEQGTCQYTRAAPRICAACLVVDAAWPREGEASREKAWQGGDMGRCTRLARAPPSLRHRRATPGGAEAAR